VIGLGGIGTQVAQRAAAFGMRVLAVDPVDVPMHRDVAYVGKPDELDALLQADVVFAACPYARSRRCSARSSSS
jgi:phosphoglycerate dehydrogenase-like enzyme